VGGRAWVGVRVGLDEQTLTRLPELVGLEGDWASLATTAVSSARSANAWTAASLGASALLLASGEERIEEGAARSLFERLGASPAHLVILRPAR